MGKKSKNKYNTSSSTNRQTESSIWKIAAIVAIIFSMGLLAKVIFYPGQAPMTGGGGEIYEFTSAPPSTGGLEEQVRLVAKDRCGFNHAGADSDCPICQLVPGKQVTAEAEQ